jgi:hypothetical protein
LQVGVLRTWTRQLCQHFRGTGVGFRDLRGSRLAGGRCVGGSGPFWCGRSRPRGSAGDDEEAEE